MSEVLQNGVDAIALGSVTALFALGIALIFGVMRLVNLAHGEILMTAGYVLYVTDGLPWPVRLFLALAGGVVVAAVVMRFALQPLRGSDPVTLLVGSLAVSSLLQNAARVWQSDTAKAPAPLPLLDRAVDVLGVRLSVLSLVAIAVTAVLLVGLRAMLERTSVGLQLRAAAEDATMARLMGVRADAVILSAFAIGGLLGAIGGVLLVSQTGTVAPTAGVPAMLLGLIACVVGGLGSLNGAVLGGMLLGSASVVLQAVLPLDARPYRDAILFAAVFAVILLRPQGLIRTDALVERV